MILSERIPLRRIRLGGILLASVFLLALLGYRVLGDYSWSESLWMVVITISTVGYGESSGLTPGMQLFTVMVIILGMTSAVYTFSGFFHMLLEGELERIIGRRRMARDLEQLDGHIIICGYGRMGQHLAAELSRRDRQLVVVDIDAERVDEAAEHGLLSVRGDATEEELLLSVHLPRAHTLVIALPSDAASVFITLTARDLHSTIQILARAEQPSTEKKLRQAGADRVVMPAVIGARQIARMITRPSTADLIELVSESNFTDLELDEIIVPDCEGLAGLSVEAAQMHSRHRLLVVAIKQPDGEILANPHGDYVFVAGDLLMVMGHDKDILAFRKVYHA
ncbi:MAG: voltage-gated potassium channel [Rhodothermales bacterium]